MVIVLPDSLRPLFPTTRLFRIFSSASINDLYLLAFVFQSVAMRFLSEIQDESITEDALKSIVRMCQYMHSSVIDASDLFLKVSRSRENRTACVTRCSCTCSKLYSATIFKVPTLIYATRKYEFNARPNRKLLRRREYRRNASFIAFDSMIARC